MVDYLTYHVESSKAKDIDPSNDALRYVADRFELNVEQRYWLAFLFGTCYSATNVYYIYNEFPDYENVDVGRLQRWWDTNRDRTLFQTDRLRVKTQNRFVETFVSYRDLLNGMTQEEYFEGLKQPTRQNTYDNAFRDLSGIRNFGRFTMFIYLEMVNVLTGFDLEPTHLDLANAESCRNGLVYHLGKMELDTHGKKTRLTKKQLGYLQYEFQMLKSHVGTYDIAHRNIWNIETTLCAYKKYRRGKRYVGYYIERMRKEINKMEGNVPTGVDWSVLWDFRRETYDPKWLNE
jgi:hypothetical protein|tara:strand:- start:1313 stop:2182 length:870 start_codon:yes stop_codon:yes gene_type:complete